MRLLLLELKNYIGIYNGLEGTTDIKIPFYKCVNNIVVIKGDNGSGKSTIFKALHPFADSNSDLIPNATASKTISYSLIDGSKFTIRYVYPIDDRGNRKTTKCYISLNDKDLNPNHNMTDGKAVIDKILDIDSSFMTLAQLSSDDRGLADKKPAQRKAFLNKNISDIDAFNSIYKKISKEANNYKTLVDSMDAKLKSIGSVETLKMNQALLSNQYNLLDKESTELIVKASKIQAKMEALVNNNVNPEQEMNNINQGLYNCQQIMKSNRYDDSITEDDLNKLIIEKAKKEEAIKNLKAQNNDKLKERASIRDKKDYIYIKLESLKDVKYLESYSKQLENYKNELIVYSNELAKYGINAKNITIEDYNRVIRAFELLIRAMDMLDSAYSQDTVLAAFDNLCHGYKIDLDELQKQIYDMQTQYNNMERLIDKQEFYKKHSVGIKKIPADCPHKNDCVFVKNIVEAYNSILPEKDYDMLCTNMNNIKKDIKIANQKYEFDKKAKECVYQLTNIIHNDSIFGDYILDTMYNIAGKDLFKRDDESRIALIVHNLYDNPTSNNVHTFVKVLVNNRNILTSYSTTKKNIDNLTDKIKSLSSSKEIYEMYSKELESVNRDEISINSNIDRNNKSIEFTYNDITNISHKIDSYKLNIERKTAYLHAEEEYKSLLEKKDKYKADSEAYIALSKELEAVNDRNTSILNNQMSGLRKQIDEITYSLKMYNEYVKDYNLYKDNYTKYSKLKYYVSPNTGIQTVYEAIFMNSILSEANELLSMFFEGQFQLQPFIINDKEFRMPVLGSGIMNDDISSMSNAQICMTSMILSFVLMHKASKIYNIIKLDEIDGALDTNNRSVFFSALYLLMHKLGFDQCVLISHNSELNTQNMDMIILKNTDSNMKIDGNVIYKY